MFARRARDVPTALPPTTLSAPVSLGRKRRHPLFGRSAGTTTVEFAIVAGLYLLLMFALIDFALLGFVNLTMQHAVREGTRYAVTGRSDLDPDNEGDRYRAVVQKIRDNSMGFFDKVMKEEDIKITRPDGTPVAGFGASSEIIVITLNCTWPLMTPLVSPFFNDGKYTFTVGATMKNEGF